MKSVVRILILAALVFSTGCDKKADEKGDKPAAADKAKAETPVEVFHKIVDQICACKDKACADEAQKGMAKLAKAKDFVPTAEQSAAMTKSGDRMAKCMAKLAAAEQTK